MNKSYIHELPEAWQSISQVFVALGEPQRQRLLLAFEPGESLSVGQLCDASTLSRPTVSHHLKVLRQAGVLHSEKLGKEVHYRVNRQAITTALTNVLDYLKA